MPNLGAITLGKTMVHEVPRGSAKANATHAVVLSQTYTALDSLTDRFMREQMLTPYIQSGRDIVAIPDTTAPPGAELELVPRSVLAVLADPTTLPDRSREIAEHLFASQRGSASAGIFIASTGRCSVGECIVLMKAEHQEGVRMRQRGSGANVSFDVEHIAELIVGRNSKVYKIAVLWSESGKVVGKMVDKQNGVAFADYFLHDFLGMDLQFQAEKQTRDFVDAVTKHINTAVDPEKRTRYTRALVTELESPTSDIDVTQFITTRIDREDRDGFAAALPAEVQRTSFRKDTTLIAGQIGGIVFSLQDGEVQVRATNQAVATDRVLVDDANNRVIITGLPDSIKPASPPKKPA